MMERHLINHLSGNNQNPISPPFSWASPTSYKRSSQDKKSIESKYHNFFTEKKLTLKKKKIMIQTSILDERSKNYRTKYSTFCNFLCCISRKPY